MLQPYIYCIEVPKYESIFYNCIIPFHSIPDLRIRDHQALHPFLPILHASLPNLQPAPETELGWASMAYCGARMGAEERGIRNFIRI